jgi:hypothetical protein
VPKEIPISPRLIPQLSKVTVKSVIDALVELITNSDDSYRRLEEKGGKISGKIEVMVIYEKGGKCEIEVKDYAEGMTREQLENALVFAGETSGFQEGKSVRGFFGRGLKEAIIALGEGTIRTIKNGKEYKTKVWYDEKEKKALYDDFMLGKSQDTNESNGTTVTISVKNPKIKCPTYKTFWPMLTNHFALRDINSSPYREVALTFLEEKRGSKPPAKYERKIEFILPPARKVLEKEVIIPTFIDKVKLTIYESFEPLEPPINDPCARAGILIKTRGAILDNRLFGFESEPAARYFFGEAICEGLEQQIRGEEGIVDPNRGGLEWRHEYCKMLEECIKNEIAPLISKKKKELEVSPHREVSKETKRLLGKICQKLNEIASEELEDEETEGIEKVAEIEIENLTIKPEKANVQRDIPRTFAIYAPLWLINKEGTEVRINCDNPSVELSANTLQLMSYPKFPEKLYYATFKIVAKAEDAKAVIEASLGKESARAIIQVAPPGIKRGKKLKGSRKVFVESIVLDHTPNPSQRAMYDKGIIRIFVNFPSVKKFIGSGFEGIDRPEGKILMAEVVGEAIFRLIVMKNIENGRYPLIAGGEIDAFLRYFNDLQKKWLHLIYETIIEAS